MNDRHQIFISFIALIIVVAAFIHANIAFHRSTQQILEMRENIERIDRELYGLYQLREHGGCE